MSRSDRIAAWLPFVIAKETERGPSKLQDEVTALFDAFRAPLLRYLRTFRLSSSDAEDVVQEVFLALFQHLCQNKSRENLRGWIFRVGHNLALKRRRVPETGPQPDFCLVDLGQNPEEQAALRQKHAKLQAIMRALPEQDRRCLILRAEGLRYREISDVLKMPLSSVAASLTRSLDRLSRIQ